MREFSTHCVLENKIWINGKTELLSVFKYTVNRLGNFPLQDQYTT